MDTDAYYYKIVVQKVPEYVGVEIGDYKINGDLDVTGNITGSSNSEIDVPRKSYDTGWISRNTWQNVHMGSNTTKDVDSNVVHNLDVPIIDLLVKVAISPTGADSDSFEIPLFTRLAAATARYGYTIFNIDNNNLKIQTGDYGIAYAQDSDGNDDVIDDADDWYYRIKVFKLG